MYEEIVKRLHGQAVDLPEKFSKNAELLDVLMEAADAIKELTGFVQEAERDRDEYRERLDKANDAIEFLQTYKVAFENIISMGGWWLVGQDKNLHRMNVPMNWPPKGTKTVEVFPLPAPPTVEEDE